MSETNRTGHAVPRSEGEVSPDQKATLLRTEYSVFDPFGLLGATEDPDIAERYSRKGFRVTARTEAIEG